MHLIFIPGLGYDHRIFSRLQLPDAAVQYLDWIDPEPGEAIEAYARRMYNLIRPGADKLVLIGHSFGGIMAQEIARLTQVNQVILLGSIRSRAELPMSFRIVNPLGASRLLTRELCLRTIPYWGASHGFESSEDQALFKSMVGGYSNLFLQWALRQLSGWRPPAAPVPAPVTQIHGTHDKTFPFKLIQQPDVVVEGGSHIFVYKRAEECAQHLQQILEKQ